MNPVICFITGPCASGKSTIGKLLAQDDRFKRAMFLQVDEIRRAVWKGYVPPFPESEASREQLELAARAAARISKLYYQKGFFVFLEDILEPWLLPIYDEELNGCLKEVVCILPAVEEILKRDQARSQSEQMGNRCLELWSAFQEWAKKEQWNVVDSTTQSPDQTALNIGSLIQSKK